MPYGMDFRGYSLSLRKSEGKLWLSYIPTPEGIVSVLLVAQTNYSLMSTLALSIPDDPTTH